MALKWKSPSDAASETADTEADATSARKAEAEPADCEAPAESEAECCV